MKVIYFACVMAFISGCGRSDLKGLFMIDEIVINKSQRETYELYSMNIVKFTGSSIATPPSFRGSPCGECSWRYLDNSSITIECSQRCWFEGNWRFAKQVPSEPDKTVYNFSSKNSSFTLSR
jgi:hypothetical protein